MHDDATGLAINRINQPRHVRSLERGQRGIQCIAGVFRHCFGNAHIVGMQAGGEQRFLPLGYPPGHANRLPARGRTIIHAGVGDITAEQPRHLRLKLKQHLQRALRDFGLIGRIGSEEFAPLDQVIDTCWHMMLIRAATEEKGIVASRHILTGKGGHMPLNRHFTGVIGQARDGAG